MSLLRVIQSVRAFGLIILSSYANASCLADEMKNQATDLKAYDPVLWHLFKSTPVPEMLKVLSSDPNKWGMLAQKLDDLATSLNPKLRTEAQRTAFILETKNQLSPNGGINISVWNILIAQAVVRCLESGKEL